MTYGEKTFPVYVTVNVESNDGSHDLVLVQSRSSSPPDPATEVFDSEDAASGLSYAELGLHKSQFRSQPPQDMTALVYETIEGDCKTIAVYGQYYVVSYFGSCRSSLLTASYL